MSYFTRLLPPWPVVPPRLWLTVAIILIASLNLIFKAEIWPHTPHAAQVWQSILVPALLVAVPQAIWVLWAWPAVYNGPWWAASLFRLLVVGAAGLLLLLEVALAIGFCYFMMRVPS